MKKDLYFALSDAPLGCSLRIRHLHATPALSMRLRELGFRENAALRGLTRGFGSMICEVGASRIGIDSDIARAIRVSVLE